MHQLSRFAIVPLRRGWNIEEGKLSNHAIILTLFNVASFFVCYIQMCDYCNFSMLLSMRV